MENLINVFDERVIELDSYLKVLDRFENPDASLINRATGKGIRVFGDESFKVMKASVFLQLYNLVESTVRSAFGDLYKKLEEDGKTYNDVNVKMRSMWVEQRFRNIDFFTASPRNFRELSEKLTESVLSESILSLSSRDLPLSGNLNADEIRKVCVKHGFEIKSHYRARGGHELNTVKLHRNNLSHGHLTFADCGQQFTVSDLVRIKKETVNFVRSFLRSIKKFADTQGYE